MKKILLALLLGSLLVLGVVTTVLADNGPHGSFTATTDACANCHRAHTAQFGSNALTIMDPEALCESCHDGSNAGTNVVDGVYAWYKGSNVGGYDEGTPGKSLFGGGFTNALMATAWDGKNHTAPDAAQAAVSRPVTSEHNLGPSGGTIWGAGAVNSPKVSMVLECTSCHDPHGNAGWDTSTTPDTRVATYRLLRWQPQGSNGFTPPATAVNWSGGAFPNNDATTPVSGWTVPDAYAALGTEWYTIGTTGAFAPGDYNAGNADNVYKVSGHSYLTAAINVPYFCAQCHDRYFNNSRLRNNTDVSMYCGSPLNATTPPYTGSPLFLPYQPDSDGVYPWIHPVDSVRCEPVVNSAGVLTGWGDNGNSGDAVYTYRHSSGDIRLSMDGATAAGAGTSVSRACVACHVSHGTAAQMTSDANNASLAKNSALLRLDNRAICLRCHAGAVGFTVPTVP